MRDVKLQRWVPFVALVVAACKGGEAPPPAASSSQTTRSSAPSAASSSSSGAPSASGSASAPTAGVAPPALAPGGEDFAADAKDLFRIAACGGTADVPQGFDAETVNEHCKELKGQVDKYVSDWINVATPFIAKLKPEGLPKDVVYPFGGGDLVTALVVYPDLQVLTTISLEPGGDVRAFRKLGPSELRSNLGLARSDVKRLFEMSFHSTAHLDVEARTKIPGELFFALLALRIHGYEPAGLRYFNFKDDGSIRYLEKDEIDKATAASHTFDDMELVFEKPGDPSSRKILRHIEQNLDDKHMTADTPLMKHLVAKGDVSAITKAASHLLWSEDFSTIRSYLAKHLVWMISDSTGIPPRIAQASGLVQETYGTFQGPAPYGMINDHDAADFRKLFKANPEKPLPFLFGYWDSAVHGHMIVTHRK